MKRITLLMLFLQGAVLLLQAQPGPMFQWSKEGSGTYQMQKDGIAYMPCNGEASTLKVPVSLMTPAGSKEPLDVQSFQFYQQDSRVLLFTNTRRVWRYETKGDYWVLDLNTKKLRQLGKGRPASSLMFAKISPDGKNAAYVSEHNIYVEDLNTGAIKALTTNGNRHFINGTFDWVYEEELDCRDGFRWSPDSKSIAYWQLDATKTRDFLMINNTDSIYSFTIPVEYPVAGQDPSACRVGVVNIQTARTNWMNVPGDPRQHYIPRMEWIPNSNELIIQQLNRRQNESKIMVCRADNGATRTIYTEKDAAWIDTKGTWDDTGIRGWDFLPDGKSFLWLSEEDGWRHIYHVSLTNNTVKLLTPGNYDVIKLLRADEATNAIYFLASPDNPVQQYLYKVPMTGGPAEKLTPAAFSGTNKYEMSPNSLWTYHSLSTWKLYRPLNEFINLKEAPAVSKKMEEGLTKFANPAKNLEYVQVTTVDGVKMDGFMVRPTNFDPSKKYPVIFTVYGGPAAATTLDSWHVGRDRLYKGNMADDGYVYVSFDNRGTPLPKGREWRKAIYQKIGVIDTRDQAMAAKALMEKYSFIDSSRTLIWGWSGGGTMTLNLLCQYPGVFKSGVSIAPVTNLLTYDNIYQERYTGLPQEDMEAYKKGSPVSYAEHMEGNLLMIQGTGDDNVHYQNSEMMLNALIKYNKQLQFMAYPNRSHSISEGEGTDEHLSTLFTNFVRTHCAPGAR
ncbi:dipeptidyl-peptidase-4 [Chitinophaga dinghuensis]|uniref:Dipeptidyl-peptidase-4 n=1 Tax=Chitinophaga dinghuensis TaxID=1539050 RepID=A0A327VVJ8_9BACT|nr:DPP IV N-terminal domain-containing protein [Chitinophaga dinghuensis]RAJ79323.1 dipeptidyl-peptidase-4 [Chitinophaga dinghuensis]